MKIAVFCPLKDEKTFSPLWLEYYSRFIPKEDIYVLDFNSKELDHMDCNIVKTDRNIFDAIELFQEVKRFHAELLKKYDFVIPTDVDEILFHPDGLGNFVNNFKGNYVKATGYEVLHLPDKEPDLDPTKKILEQRNFWIKDPFHYDKTLITNKPLDWSIGLHICHDPVDQVEKNLLLIHLHKFDFKTTTERHLKFANETWSEHTIKHNLNFHYRNKKEEDVKKWFFYGVEHVQEIPSKLKTLINI